jgi:hypothetical protein
MSYTSTIANYGGKTPNNNQQVKQFVTSAYTTLQWIFKKITSGITVITLSTDKYPVLINNDLYVNGSIYNPSDINLKKNISPISETKKNYLTNLEPVEFEFNNDNRKHYGFIAQDMELLYPELVNNDKIGYKTINYVEIIPILLQKIKDMQKEIDELKERVIV